MLKLAGALLILAAGTFLGFAKSAAYANRPKHIRQLIHALQMLETEIEYGFTPLPEAMLKISRHLEQPLSKLFEQAGSRLASADPVSTKEAWEEAVASQGKYTALGANEREVLLRLGASLGTSDRENQMKHLRLASIQLRGDEETAKDEQKRYEKMWKSLGVLGGALIVVVMY